MSLDTTSFDLKDVSSSRDLKFLFENSYELEDLKIVDMFPHTQHIECVGIIKNKKMRWRR